MINASNQTSLRDAMYAMSLAKPVPDAELLEDFIRRYPHYADALTKFAIELAIDALVQWEVDEDIVADPDVTSPVVARIMSQFENRLYERRQTRTAGSSTRVVAASPANPFATLDRSGFRALASQADLNTAILSKLRDRLIDPVTIPKGFRTFLADEMDILEETLTAHLFAVPEISQPQQFYKAEGKPVLTAKQTFEQAVRNSGLSDDQQRRLLSFRG
jgi:hypothetical protein